MIQNNVYKTVKKNEIDNPEDYDIWFKDKWIDELQLTIHQEYVFIRQISVDGRCRRCGHATNIIDEMRHFYNKPIRICISTHSKSAVLFWENYFKIHNAEKVKGNLYCLTV